MEIVNNYIPLKGFTAMAVFPLIFVRKEFKANVSKSRYARTLRHEHIHHRQQIEMLIVFFYLWYVVEWLVRLIQYKSREKAYRNISFEREAYANQEILAYERMKWNFINYL